ncbi:MAG: M23 family metallopeptidase [Candidatus Firestonebacteria bacterium]
MNRLLTVLFLSGFCFSAEAASVAPKVEVSSTKVTHGGILVVKVFDKTAKRVQIKKSVFPLFDGKEGASKGVLLGVPAWWDIGGKYDLKVDGRKTGQVVEVGGRVFKSEEIEIEKSRLVANEETAKQRKRLAKEISFLKDEKYWSGNFIKPVEGRITTEYGMGRVVNGSPGGIHRGLDIAADEGTEIKAANNGVVTLSRNHILTGNTIVINHGAGVVSVYYHMSALIAEENAKVKKGEIIGKVGSTGVSTGAHLHWGIWIFGVDVNPLELIEKEIEF